MKVDSKLWSRMDDDQQMDALLTVFKDPDDAEMYVGEKWDDLPEEKNFMTTTIKPLAEEDATSWKYNNSPARGGTLDLVPRKVGQSIKEKVFKGLKEQYSTGEEDKDIISRMITMGGYVEEMDLDDHLDNIHYEFEKFQAMTTTDIKDIPPAKEELISYVVDYLRNTL